MRISTTRLSLVEELENNIYPLPSLASGLVSAQDIGMDVSSSDNEDASPHSHASASSESLKGMHADSQTLGVEHILHETSASLLQASLTAHERMWNLWAPVAPKNFGEVAPGLYRSSFPRTENLTFLAEKGIKTIITFVPEVYTSEQANFIRELDIRHIRIPIEANKDAFNPHPHTPVIEALGHLLDRNNYPILIHCNKGKHRTGCVVACYRKFLGWDRNRILQEYRQYAGLKARALDELFIDRFDERAMQIMALQTHLIDSHNEPMSDSPITSLIPNSRLRG